MMWPYVIIVIADCLLEKWAPLSAPFLTELHVAIEKVNMQRDRDREMKEMP